MPLERQKGHVLKTEVVDQSDLRKYRTEIPNLVLEMGLSPHALALYIHFKRTAGQDGACWKSTRTLSKAVGMSTGKVSEARQELEDRELIKVKRPEDQSKSITIAIVDIWASNFAHFAADENETEDQTERSEYERSVQNMNTERSEYERRKEPIEEGTINKEETKSDYTEKIFQTYGNLPDDLLEALLRLYDLKGYPKDIEENFTHLEKLRTKHQLIWLPTEVDKFCDYYEEQGFKSGHKPRARLTNWISNARAWAKPTASGALRAINTQEPKRRKKEKVN